MAEDILSDKKITAESRYYSCLKQLMDAIHCSDKVICSELLSKMSARQVNNLVRLKYPGYVGYTVTPLLWAVINGCHDIVELLSLHHAKVNKCGTYKVCETLHSLSPLLKAVQNSDSKMVGLLLEKGADVQLGVPGERTEEEEGGTLQYNRYLYPLNVCLGKDLDIFRMLLHYSDTVLEYGPGKHTSLCYAVENLYENDCISNPTNLCYVQEVLDHGGKICQGAIEYQFSNLPGKRMCCFLRTLVWKLVSEKGAIEDLGLTSYMKYFQCLQLVSLSDYSHGQSPVYHLCKHFAELVELEVTYPQPIVDVIQMIKSAKSPSSLQHITRVAIRCFVKPFNRQQCERLNLPTKLLSYIMLDVC